MMATRPNMGEGREPFPFAALASFPPPVRRMVAGLDRRSIEATVQALIDVLDALDGDPDLEPGDDAEPVDERESDTKSEPFLGTIDLHTRQWTPPAI